MFYRFTDLGVRSRRRIMAIAAILTIPVLAGCGLDESAASEPAPPVAAEAAEALRGAPPLAWGPCAGAADPRQQCATIEVPLDYQAPRGRKIEIAISRIPSATPDLRRGVLLLNPGGPGGSGLDLPSFAVTVLPQSVLDRYDLIGFDPRFVGSSTPLTCGLTALERGPQHQPAGFDATIGVARDIAERCRAAAGSFLPFATTANTARDLDLIRCALGEPTISYLGYSYGTYLGAVYASMFADHVDRFILDSAVDPGAVWRGAARAWGPGGEQRFGDFAAFAAAHADTYHVGSTAAEVHRFALGLIDQLDRAPIALAGGRSISGEAVRSLTFQGLYAPDDVFPQIAEIWGDTVAAAREHRPPSDTTIDALTTPAPDNTLSAGFSILCGDAAWPRSVDHYRRELAQDLSRSPLFAPIGSTIWPCAFWPGPPREAPIAISARGPRQILILQHLRDPATPYAGALAMRAALGARARLVSVDEGGHTVYAVTANRCANAAGDAFLASGTLPASDMFCPAEPPAAPSGARASDAAASEADPDATARDQAIRALRRRITHARL